MALFYLTPLIYENIFTMKRKHCHHFFETLATRLKLDILMILEDSPKCVKDIAKEVGEERSKVSHALRTLHHCSFVFSEKDGRKNIYRINEETVIPLLEMCDRHTKKFCKGKCNK
jgi:DNA-binding transcriptional ArsR family regulator